MEKAGIACPISGPVVTAAWATSAVAAKARIRFRGIRFAALYRAAANSAAKQLKREMSIQPISRGGPAIFPEFPNILLTGITTQRNNSRTARDEALKNRIKGAQH